MAGGEPAADQSPARGAAGEIAMLAGGKVDGVGGRDKPIPA